MTDGKSVAIIGSGPMAIYLVKALLCREDPLRLTLFERADTAGLGMPYNPDLNADFMMANIFSDEIPTILHPFAAWLRAQPQRLLATWNLRADEISARAFYPRTLLGLYLADQLQGLQDLGAGRGHQVTILTSHDVTDVQPASNCMDVVYQTPHGHGSKAFDHVVLATGHVWPDPPMLDGVLLQSPWPASGLEGLPAARIGILGSALSAVDVAVALAHDHGHFTEHENGVAWAPKPGHEAMSITMVSRTGILPEADFHYPYPYEPLTCLTETAVAAELGKGADGLLDRVFALMVQELQECDPAYLEGLNIDPVSIEAFAAAYFARRQRLGAFRALRLNLAESRATIARKQTVAWRYALLRGHEAFEPVLPGLSKADWQRFREHLLPVFADSYAAVPHLSLDRLAALHNAGALDALKVSDDAEFLADHENSDVRAVSVTDAGSTHRFGCMIDARGQAPAGVADLPFPSLVDALGAQDAPLTAPFRLPLGPVAKGSVHCLSMPQILEQCPFSQGLPNCAQLAETVAQDLLAGWLPQHRSVRQTVSVPG